MYFIRVNYTIYFKFTIRNELSINADFNLYFHSLLFRYNINAYRYNYQNNLLEDLTDKYNSDPNILWHQKNSSLSLPCLPRTKRQRYNHILSQDTCLKWNDFIVNKF